MEFNECAYLVLLTFGIINAQAITVNISSTATNWTQGVGSCNALGLNSNQTVLDANITVVGPNSGEAWIGAYAVPTTWIKIIGCFDVAAEILSIVSFKNSTSPANSVLTCLHFCSGSLNFALNEDVCYCLFDEITSVWEASVKCYPIRCPANQEDFCGAHQNSSTTSIVLYQKVSAKYLGQGNCLGVEYNGTVYSNTLNLYDFKRPIVMSCDTDGLGYAYRSVLRFPSGHTVRLFELPRSSWMDAVDHSYKTGGYGILEFDRFSFPTTNLNMPSEGDRYWVGVFRKRLLVFQNDLSTLSNEECVAATVDASGRLMVSYHDCNKSLPVLCDVSIQNARSTSQSSLTTDPADTTVISTTTERKIISIRSGSDPISGMVWYILLAVLLALLFAVAVFFLVWFIRKYKSKKANIRTNKLPSSPSNVYCEIDANENGEKKFSVMMSEKSTYKKRMSRRLSEKNGRDKIENFNSVPSATNMNVLEQQHEGPRRESEYSVIKNVIHMYGENEDNTTTLSNIHRTSLDKNMPDVVPEGNYFVLEKVDEEEESGGMQKRSFKLKPEEAAAPLHVYHVVEPSRDLPKSEFSKTDEENIIPLSGWVGKRASNFFSKKISKRKSSSSDEKSDCTNEQYGIAVNKPSKTFSLRAQKDSVKTGSSHPNLKSTLSAPPLKLFYRGASFRSKSYRTSDKKDNGAANSVVTKSIKFKAPEEKKDDKDIISTSKGGNTILQSGVPKHTKVRFSEIPEEKLKRDSTYDTTRSARGFALETPSNEGDYDTMASVREYLNKKETKEN